MSNNKPLPSAPVLAAFCTALLALAWLGCGGGSGPAAGHAPGSNTVAVSSQALSATARQPDGDGDNDRLGMSGPDFDHDSVPTFGRPATAGERKAITALFERYYADAASGDPAGVCSLLYPLAVEGLLETHGRDQGFGSLRGSSCRQLVGGVLARKHHLLVAERSALKVGIIQVDAKRAMVLLDFGGTNQQVTLVHGEGSNWTLTTLHEEAL